MPRLSAARSAPTDKAKLDEYLTSVREVEKRVDGMRKNKDKAEDLAKQKNRPVFSMDRPANGLPEDLREHARLMCDIIAIAFQTDKTRVATLLLARDLSAMYYPFLEVREGHHAASHNNPSDGYERIARFHLSQLAYLADEAGQHAGRRRHGARQLVPDVPFEHVDRPQARQHAPAAGARRRPGRHAQDRTHAGLSGRRRRQSEDVQFVSLDHGSDGREARQLRRRRYAPGAAVAVAAIRAPGNLMAAMSLRALWDSSPKEHAHLSLRVGRNEIDCSFAPLYDCSVFTQLSLHMRFRGG